MNGYDSCYELEIQGQKLKQTAGCFFPKIKDNLRFPLLVPQVASSSSARKAQWEQHNREICGSIEMVPQEDDDDKTK